VTVKKWLSWTFCQGPERSAKKRRQEDKLTILRPCFDDDDDERDSTCAALTRKNLKSRCAAPNPPGAQDLLLYGVGRPID
jgi:hypothetical protein